MLLNVKHFSADLQSLLELRDNIQVTIDALSLFDDEVTLDLVVIFEKHLAELNELIEKLTRGTAEPVEAAPDPILDDLLTSMQIKVPQEHPDNLPGGCTFTLPADVSGRGPKRS